MFIHLPNHYKTGKPTKQNLVQKQLYIQYWKLVQKNKKLWRDTYRYSSKFGERLTWVHESIGGYGKGKKVIVSFGYCPYTQYTENPSGPPHVVFEVDSQEYFPNNFNFKFALKWEEMDRIPVIFNALNYFSHSVCKQQSKLTNHFISFKSTFIPDASKINLHWGVFYDNPKNRHGTQIGLGEPVL